MSVKQTKKEIANLVVNCRSQYISVMKFFDLMKVQQSHYSDFIYAGNGAFSFVLKAKNKNSGQIVALKVTECHDNDISGMQQVQDEYRLLRQFSNCKYIVQVFNCFFLTVEESSDEDSSNDEEEQKNVQSNIKKQKNQKKLFFVVEQEFCQNQNEFPTVKIYRIEIKFAKIYPNYQLDRQSFIYKIASLCLNYSVENRKSAIDLLIQFIQENQNYLIIELSSVINRNQLKLKSEQLSQIQKTIIEKQQKKNSEIIEISQSCKNKQHFKNLIEMFNVLKQKPFSTLEYENILKLLQSFPKYDSNFEFISVGAKGLVLGVFNKTLGIKTVLKIQQVQSKHEVVQEVGIMRDCQMPLVIKFYNYFYLSVNKNDDFVVYEIEKCSADFDQSRKMPFDLLLINGELTKDYFPVQGICGTFGYIAPEFFDNIQYTFDCEIFSVGVCLALLDNFEKLEPVIQKKAQDYFFGFKIPFEQNFHIKEELINRKSQIYEILQQTIVFKQKQRKQLSKILLNLEKQGYLYYSKVFSKTLSLKCQKHLNNDILFVKVNNIKDEEDVFYCDLCPFTVSNFSMSDCTPIKSILNWNEESPIFNLFPFNDQELIKKLKDIFHENIYEQLPYQINQFYDNLQARIIQMIAKSKKRSVMLASQLCEQKQKSIKQYKQAVNADEIKKILQSQNLCSNQIQKIYKDCLKTIFQNSERNTKIIQDLYNEQQITYSQLKQVQQKIISSSLLSIKNDVDFIRNFSLIFPNQVDLMPQLEFRKLDYQTNQVSQNDIIKMINESFFGGGSNSMDLRNQFQIIKGNLNHSFNIETIIEIKILISKGMFEASDYPNKQIVASLSQNYESDLKCSQNDEFSISISGSLALLQAIETQQEI
ncbi:hypothetical protein ABPG72_017640 [Tetrahymena utriculariae]